MREQFLAFFLLRRNEKKEKLKISEKLKKENFRKTFVNENENNTDNTKHRHQYKN